MKLKEIVNILEDYAPLAFQESYDNSGLLIGNENMEINGVLCTTDIDEKVFNEAISLNLNLIISHHPLIFKGIKSLTEKNTEEKLIIKAIKNDIAIYSAHTNFDNIVTGVNAKIAEKLDLKNIRTLSPAKEKLIKLVTFVPESGAEIVRDAIFKAGAGVIGEYDCCSFNAKGEGTFRASENTNPYVGEKGNLHVEPEIRIETILPESIKWKIVQAMTEAHPYEEVAYDLYPLLNEYSRLGSGLIGELEKPVSLEELLDMLKINFQANGIRYAGSADKPIKRIALCGGSGSFLISDAKKNNADVFITGDVKYHQFFDSGKDFVIIDIGHYESEQFTKEIFYEVLTKKIPKFAVHLSKVNTNPIKYYC